MKEGKLLLSQEQLKTYKVINSFIDHSITQGKGKRKPEIQQLYDDLEDCGTRLMGYRECFEIMGKDRVTVIPKQTWKLLL